MSHLMSSFPGKLGEYVRRAYYRWTLDSVGRNLVVGYGTFFTHTEAILAHDVWIGQYSIIGKVKLESNVLVGDRVLLLSGRHQHRHDAAGNLIEDKERQTPICIGRSSWIGAGAIVMADVGAGSIVGAGSVVVKRVESGAVVAGNPAKNIQK